MDKILIIDDEADAIDLLREFLQARGFNVVWASNGEEGLKKFASEAPNIVICDIRMPKKDGFEFLKELRKEKTWVPVIILSAMTDPTNILKSYDLEADYYLTKPINLPDALKAITLLLSLAPHRKS